MKLRPRFALRTLVVIVTLVCAYFGAWEVTKRHDRNSPAPFVGLTFMRGENRPAPGGSNVTIKGKYYLWLFGPTIDLFETTTTTFTADSPASGRPPIRYLERDVFVDLSK